MKHISDYKKFNEEFLNKLFGKKEEDSYERPMIAFKNKEGIKSDLEELNLISKKMGLMENWVDNPGLKPDEKKNRPESWYYKTYKKLYDVYRANRENRKNLECNLTEIENKPAEITTKNLNLKGRQIGHVFETIWIHIYNQGRFDDKWSKIFNDACNSLPTPFEPDPEWLKKAKKRG
jgi:hypothetical protein